MNSHQPEVPELARVLLESSASLRLISTPNGRLVAASEGMVHALHYRAEGILLQAVPKLLDLLDLDSRDAGAFLLGVDGPGGRAEIVCRASEGRRASFLASSRRVVADGVEWVIITCEPVLGQSSTSLERMADACALLMEEVPLAVVLCNHDGRIVRCNMRTARMMGSPSLEFTRNINLLEFPPLVAAGLSDQIRECLKTGQRTQVVSPYRSLWGKDLVLSSLIVPVMPSGAAGTPEGVLAFVDDITVKREAEKALLEAKDAAESSNAAKSEFLANMSHEIRTPLNAVLGFLTLLSNANLDEEKAEYVQIARSSAESLLRLINEILDLSKIEVGKLALSHSAFDPRSVLQEVQRIAIPPDLRARGTIRLCSEIASDVPSQIVSDSGRYKQILMNLASNAVKFTESGSITFRIAARKVGGLDCLVTEVEDTGIGIHADKIPKLFQQFSQIDTGHSRRYEGTGLGLAISRKLVHLMGGEIGVDSASGVGSRFWFAIPVKPPHRSAEEMELTASTPHVSQHPMVKRILLVDDNPGYTQLVQRSFREAGIAVEIAHSGTEAIAIAGIHSFDLILMDCQMPSIDGFETSRRIRQEGVRAPIVALTGLGMSRDRVKCQQAGMDGFLRKPLDCAELPALVAPWLAGGLPNA